MARLNSQVTTRRTATICCIRAQAAYRGYLIELLGTILEAISDLPLEAGAILPLAPIRTPVPIRLPVRKLGPDIITLPGFGPGDPFQSLVREPQTQTLPLARPDAAAIGIIVGLIQQTPAVFDCENCNRQLRQNKPRQTFDIKPVESILGNDEVTKEAKRVDNSARNR